MIVVAAVAVVWLALRLAFDVDNPFYVVSSGSMVPALDVNDVIVVRDGSSWDGLEVGDVIVFTLPEGKDRVIVHRIVEIDDTGDDGRIVTTKGDANPSSIAGVDHPIMEENYVGEVVHVVAGAGAVTAVLSPPVNYVIIVAILAALFFGRRVRKDGDSSAPSE